VLPYWLAKNDFIAFPAGFGDTVLKNNGMQIFLTLGDLLLPWQRNAFEINFMLL